MVFPNKWYQSQVGWCKQFSDQFLVQIRMEELAGGMVKLTSSNYSIWKPRMEDILYTKDLYLPIHGDKRKPAEMNDDDWEVLNRKSVVRIR